MDINLDLTNLLRPWQKQFFENAKSYNVLVLHRRAWKTVVAILFLIYKALQTKGSYWYITPFRSQAKSVAWEMLNKFVSQIPWTEKNISELYISLPNWSRITLFWADNQDALRWLDLRWVVLDEYAQMSKNLYSEIIFPMINAHTDWWTTWIGTPKWKNAFYDLYHKAITSDKYYTMYLNVYETWILPEEKIQEAKNEQDEESFRQEYLLDWDVAIKWSYYWKQIQELRDKGRIISHLYDNALWVYTAWDLWVNDSMVVLFFQYYNWQIRIIDEYDAQWEGFPHFFDVLSNRKYNYIMHFLPHDIAVKELWTGLTRLETFQKMFWYDKTQVLKRQSVEDWINMVRQILPKCWFDASLEKYLNIICEYRPKYDEKTEEFGKPIHCDYSDAIRYLATAYNLFVETYEDYETFSINYDNLI